MDTDGYAIFICTTLLYVSTANSRDEAYGEMAEDVGFDRSVYPMDRDEVGFHYIPATDMDKWKEATANNYPTVNHPL